MPRWQIAGNAAEGGEDEDWIMSDELKEQDAYDLGAKGGPACEKERKLFEAWMRGHCWALSAKWDGESYRGTAEHGAYICPHAMTTRQLWAAWRDRAALSKTSAPAAPAVQEPVGHVDMQTPGPGDRIRWTNGALPHGTALYAAPVLPVSPGLIDLLHSLRPKYGAVGSRDVDVTETRRQIDAALAMLAAAQSSTKD